MFTWILAAFLPTALAYSSDVDCCPKKFQDPSYYILEKYVDPSDPMYSTNCMQDGCVYILEGTEMRYCFASGGPDIKCVDDHHSETSPTDPSMSYAPTMAYATNMSTDSSMTYAPSMVYATNMSTESSMTYAPSMVYATNVSTDSSIETTTTVQGCTCGKKKVGTENKDTRIVGGEAAEVNEWPWMVAISYSTTGAGSAYGCGASLISAEWLVTAAHCFFDTGVQAVLAEQITVVLGDHDKSLETDSNIKLVQYVDRIIIHPDYNDALSKNDIALIKMSTKVDLDIYTPVCLPSLNQEFSGDSWVYGWGTLQPSGSQPDILQDISLPMIDTSICSTIMALQDVTIYPGMICAGGQTGKDSCQGDSGGPMTVALNETHYLAGAVSFGIGCGVEGLYGVYAQVSYYLTWINTQISENGGAEYCPY